MRVLSLFSGIGAHDLGLEWAGMTVVGQVEIDEYCQTILKKHWPKVRKWRDIRRVTADNIRRSCGSIDLITGGFPCQDISTAGKGKGIVEGQRSGLWREMWRLIRSLRPTWLLLENVPALRTRGADSILAALEAVGYTCRSFVVGAWHAGAPHRRNRVFIVGHTDSITGAASALEGWYRMVAAESVSEESVGAGTVAHTESDLRRAPWNHVGDSLNGAGTAGALPDTESTRLEKVRRESKVTRPRNHSDGDVSNTDRAGVWQQLWRQCGTCGQASTFPAEYGAHQHDWEAPRTIKSGLGGSIDGSTRRMALKAIGNGNPPHIVAAIGRAIMKANELCA